MHLKSALWNASQSVHRSLAGMIAPTSGDAVINGMSIRDNMGTIRQNLGVCPQFDILWPDITVNLGSVICAAAQVLMPTGNTGRRSHHFAGTSGQRCSKLLVRARSQHPDIRATGGRASGAVCSHQGIQPRGGTAHCKGGCCGCWYAHLIPEVVCTLGMSLQSSNAVAASKYAQSSPAWQTSCRCERVLARQTTMSALSVCHHVCA